MTDLPSQRAPAFGKPVCPVKGGCGAEQTAGQSGTSWQGEPVHRGKAEAEVLCILHTRGYRVGRISDGNAPRLIAALRENEVLFVLAVRSRYGIRDVHAISEKYLVEIAFLRRVARGDAFRKQLWVSVPQKGWRVFEILSGGMMEVRDV